MAWLSVIDPRGRCRSVRLNPGRTFIGSSGACEVQIDDPGVAPCHASILATERGVVVLDETGHRSISHGDVMRDHLFVAEGTAFVLGQSRLVYSETGVDDREADAVVMTSSRTLLGTPDESATSRPSAPKQPARPTGPASSPTLPAVVDLARSRKR
ncbi:MAG: FHA domain-containing protein [Myxococcota bacterium]